MRRFKPYLKYLRPQLGTLVAAIICGIFYGIANGIGWPYMVQKVFPVVFSEKPGTLTMWQVAGVAAWLPIVFLVRGTSDFFNTYLIQRVGTHVLEELRLDFFRKLQSLPLAFHQRHQSGDLISRGLADANQLQATLTNVANQLIKGPATLVAALVAVIFIAYTNDGVALVLVTIGIVPLTVFPVRYVGRKLMKRAQNIQREQGEITNVLNENLSAVREVRAFGLEVREAGRFGKVSHSLIAAQLKFAKYEKILNPAIEIVSAFSISFTFLYAYQVHLSLNVFLQLILALYACYEPIKKLGMLNGDIKRGLSALDRLEEVMHAPDEITDPVKPVTCGRLEGRISFEKVVFAYKNEELVLKQVSAVIPRGAVCALVGPSGAGKSTFAQLVSRFYDVSAGHVRIDDVDVRDYRVADLRRNIAIVAQDPVLFNDTVYNNVLLGRMDATREEVEQATRDAFAYEFITQTLPDGFETIVGERGSKLSGGQKQRIALARAFLRNAPILVLDEATSALDSDSEAAIQAALKKLVVGKTVLIIAHRFSTIRDASMILVFEKGQIVSSGTHADSYAENALYRSLYDGQGVR